MSNFLSAIQEFLVPAFLGAFVVVFWHAHRKKEREKKARYFDISDPQNQLRFVRNGFFISRRPVNKEAYVTVFKAVEAHLLSLSRTYRIFPEVSMGSFLSTPNGENSQKYRRINDDAFKSINSKRVDFLIVDAYGMPALVIEYHGTGHYQGNAAERDKVKRLALEKAGIPLLEIGADLPAEQVIVAVSRHIY